MKVINDIGNLVYDDGHEICRIIYNSSVGQDYAFVTCMDIGVEHCRLDEPIPKRYWGPWNHNKPEESLRLIMHRGGKWDFLTKE